MSECLQHATARLGQLAKVAGVYVDAYMALSLVEFGLGGLLQRLPGLLPVVQTTVCLARLLPCAGLGPFVVLVRFYWFCLPCWCVRPRRYFRWSILCFPLFFGRVVCGAWIPMLICFLLWLIYTCNRHRSLHAFEPEQQQTRCIYPTEPPA